MVKKSIPEKTLSSERVFDGKFLKIQRDEVLTPDGKTYIREFIKHPGAAMIIPLLSAETTLMVKQYRHAVGQFFWEFAAGKIDAGETSLQTAHRELREETGLSANRMRYLTTIHPVIGYADEKIDLFLAEEISPGTRKLDHGEFLEPHEIAIADLMPMVRRGEITDVKTQIGVFWLEKILKEGW